MVRILLLGLLLLSGCVLDQKGRIEQPMAPPVINVPPAQKVDTVELRQGIRDDITASSNATANQMTGAVNASVSKLAEKITGLEANLSAVMNNTATLNTQASADLRARLDASVSAVAEMKATLSMVNEFNAKMENRIAADVSLIRDLKAQIGELNTKLEATVNGQVGLTNRIESKLENLTAGRDINQMPRETVEVMLGSYRMIMYIVGSLLSAITAIAGYAYRNAKKREQNQSDLLMTVLTHVQPETAKRLLHAHDARRFLL
jgi:hypothetical protein